MAFSRAIRNTESAGGWLVKIYPDFYVAIYLFNLGTSGAGQKNIAMQCYPSAVFATVWLKHDLWWW